MPCVPRLLLLAQSKFAALHTDMESHFKEEELSLIHISEAEYRELIEKPIVKHLGPGDMAHLMRGVPVRWVTGSARPTWIRQ